MMKFKDIYVNDKDKIHIPKYESMFMYLVKEIQAIVYIDGKGVSYYLIKFRWFTRFASK